MSVCCCQHQFLRLSSDWGAHVCLFIVFLIAARMVLTLSSESDSQYSLRIGSVPDSRAITQELSASMNFKPSDVFVSFTFMPAMLPGRKFGRNFFSPWLSEFR